MRDDEITKQSANDETKTNTDPYPDQSETKKTEVSHLTIATSGALALTGSVIFGLGMWVNSVPLILLGIAGILGGGAVYVFAAKTAEVNELNSPLPRSSPPESPKLRKGIAEIRESVERLNPATPDHIRGATDEIKEHIEQIVKLPSVPELPRFRPKTDKIKLTMGATDRIFHTARLQQRPDWPIEIDGWKPFLLFMPKDILSFTCSLYLPGSPKSFHMTNGEHDPIPPGYDLNFNDVAIEIVDKQLVPIFQLIYQSEAHIIVKGLFVSHTEQVIILDDVGMQFTNVHNPLSYNINRIFKYPTWKYPGKYEKSN